MQRLVSLPTIVLPLLFAGLFGATDAYAETSVTVVVPRSALAFDIPFTRLAEDGINTTEIVSWVETSRGDLSVTFTEFTYQPGERFRDMGMDSFRFHYVNSHTETIEIARVFLVADLGPEIPNNTNFNGSTTSGGNTVVDLDIGNCSGCGLDDDGIAHDIVLASADAFGSPVGFEIGMTRHADGRHTFRVEATLRDGSTIETQDFPLVLGRQAIIFDWWLSSGRAHNGGFFVRHRVEPREDAEWLATATGLDNHHQGVLWSNGSTDAPGVSEIRDVRYFGRTEAPPLPFPPRFSDTFESQTFNAWPPTQTDPPGALSIVHTAATDGDYGVSVDLGGAEGGGRLVDPRPLQEDNYRGRFLLNVSGGCPTRSGIPAAGLTVFAGRDADGRTPFAISVERDGDGRHHLRGTAFDDGSFFPTTSLSSVITSAVLVDVEWWAASAPGEVDGGLVLRLNGETIFDLALANASQRVDQVELGAFDAATGAIGTVCLDEFESWWR